MPTHANACVVTKRFAFYEIVKQTEESWLFEGTYLRKEPFAAILGDVSDASLLQDIKAVPTYKPKTEFVVLLELVNFFTKNVEIRKLYHDSRGLKSTVQGV